MHLRLRIPHLLLLLLPCTALFAIETPILSAPGAPTGNSIPAKYVLCPSFTWAPVQGAASYDVQISESPNFESLAVSPAPSVKIARYVHPTPLLTQSAGNRTLYWRVLARGSDNSTALSATYAVTLSYPSNQYSVPASATVADIRDIVTTAAANAPAVVTFADTTYTLSVPDGEFLMRAAPVDDTANITGLILRGDPVNGTRFILTNPLSSFLELDSTGSDLSNQTVCDSVTVRDFTVDYNPRPVAWGVATAAYTATNGDKIIEVEVDPNSPAFDNPWLKSTTNATRYIYALRNSNTQTGWLKQGTRHGYVVASSAGSPTTCGGTSRGPAIISQTGNVATITMATSYFTEITPRNLAAGEPGDIVVYNFEYKPLINVEKASDVTFFNLTSYGATGASYKLLWGRDYNVLSCSAIRGGLVAPINGGTLPPMGPNADGVHAQACFNGPWVENCTFEALGDDVLAYYQRPSVIVAHNASDPDFGGLASLTVRDDRALYATGHHITVYDRDVSNIAVADHACQAIWYPSGHASNPFPYHISKVTVPSSYLPSPITTDTCSELYQKNPVVFSRTRNNGYFYARNNTVKGDRGKAFILRCNDAVITGNTITGVSRSAIVFQNEPESNGFQSWNLTISNNTISACGYELWDDEALGNITVRFLIPPPSGSGRHIATDKRYVANVAITGNTIIDWSERAISAEGVVGLDISNNEIIALRTDFAPLDSPVPLLYGIYVKACTDVTLDANDFTADTRAYDAPIGLGIDLVNLNHTGNSFPPHRLFDKYLYRFRSALNSSRCLSVNASTAENAPVVLANRDTTNTDESQLWLAAKNGANWNLVNLHSTKALRPSGGSPNIGTAIMQYTFKPEWVSERWTATKVINTNYYTLYSALGSPDFPVARLSGGSSAVGTPIVLDDPATAAYGSARWTLELIDF